MNVPQCLLNLLFQPYLRDKGVRTKDRWVGWGQFTSCLDGDSSGSAAGSSLCSAHQSSEHLGYAIVCGLSPKNWPDLDGIMQLQEFGVVICPLTWVRSCVMVVWYLVSLFNVAWELSGEGAGRRQRLLVLLWDWNGPKFWDPLFDMKLCTVDCLIRFH